MPPVLYALPRHGTRSSSDGSGPAETSPLVGEGRQLSGKRLIVYDTEDMPWIVRAATGGRNIFEGGWRRLIARGPVDRLKRAFLLGRGSLHLTVAMAVSIGLVALLVGCGGPEPSPLLTPGTAELPGPNATPVPFETPPLKALQPSELGRSVTTFPSGVAPRGLAFDGEYLWEAHFGGTTVSKRSLDGEVAATYETGNGPRALVYDGGSIWVGHGRENLVTKVSPDGEILAEVRIGDSGTTPSALLFDGEFIWVASSWGNSLTKVGLDGAVIRSFQVPGDHPSPWDLAFDGEFIWVASLGSAKVTKVDRDGTVVGSFQVTSLTIDPAIEGIDSAERGVFGSGPSAIVFDGEGLWVAIGASNTVVKLATDGRRLGDFTVEGWPMGLLFDGESVWVTEYVDDTVTRLGLDGTALDTYPVERGPHVMTFDGDNVWVGNFDAGTVSRLSR